MNLTARASFVVALALTTACGPGDSPASAPDTALLVFELAREGDPDPLMLDAWFDHGAGGDADRRRVALFEALERLGEASAVRVTATEPLDGLEVTAVDLVADLPGGGRAEYSVQLESAADGTWRVTWLMGPGVDWPPRRRGRGTGLTTSTPPRR